jgi:hypothetical protein
MEMTLILSTAESEALRKIAADSCTPKDCEDAFVRVPGAPSWNRSVPNSYDMDSLTQRLLEKVGVERSYLSSSLLLRFMEQVWGQDRVRRGVIDKLPSLVRPPRTVAGQVDTLTAALTAMIANLPAVAAGEPANDVFRRLCEARKDIQRIVDSLKLFAALKGIHDSMHTLQVLGAEWLDTLAMRPQQLDQAGTLLTLLSRVITATTQTMQELPVDIVESAQRCRTISVDADRRVRSGNPDEIAFACAALRGMLMHEPPLIDAAMFAVSRELPLVQFCTLFADNERETALDLGDTLRRRLMEHALWQAADQNLYQIEQILAHPPENLIGELVDRLPWTHLYLRALFDPATSQRAIGSMNDVVSRYVLSGNGQQPPAGMVAPTIVDIRIAFDGLRAAARSAFLDVDQALKDDFSRLLKLQEPLTTILVRVPFGCEAFP